MSTFPTFAAGDRVTAQMLNDMQSTVIVATTAQTVNNTTVHVNDNTLSVPVEANASYFIEFFLIFSQSGAANSDVDIMWSVPSGTSGLKQVTGSTDGNAVDGAEYISRTETGARMGGHNFTFEVRYNMEPLASRPQCSMESALINVDGVAGNVVIQWAQGTAAAQNLSRDAFSFVRYTRIR